LLQCTSALTGAFLAIERKKFLEVSGFDEENLKISLNDIDLCLKLLDNGYYNVFTPNIELFHFESKSRGFEDNFQKLKRYKKEKIFLYNKWKHIIEDDPFFNPNISLESLEFEISNPPRNGKMLEIISKL
jgi:GT2 family glycosyltransferase